MNNQTISAYVQFRFYLPVVLHILEETIVVLGLIQLVKRASNDEKQFIKDVIKNPDYIRCLKVEER